MFQPTVNEIFDAMAVRFRADRASGIDAVIQWTISGEGGGTWHAIIKEGRCSVRPGPADRPTVTLNAAVADWIAMAMGELEALPLYTSGRLTVDGDIGLAMKLPAIFAR